MKWVLDRDSETVDPAVCHVEGGIYSGYISQCLR